MLRHRFGALPVSDRVFRHYRRFNQETRRSGDGVGGQVRLPSGTRLSKLSFSGDNYELATHRVLFTWQQRITQIVNNTMRIVTTRAHGDSDFTH